MQLLFLPLRIVDKGFRTPKVVIAILGRMGSTNHEGAIISLPAFFSRRSRAYFSPILLVIHNGVQNEQFY